MSETEGTEGKGERWREYWARSARQQGAAPTQTKVVAAKRERVWETEKARLQRYHRNHWASMKKGYEELKETAAALPFKRMCKLCGNTRARLVAPDVEWNGGYGYLAQCEVCLNRAMKEGWGSNTKFSREDDELICRLLNACGEPMFVDYEPSGLHFHRSMLAFHDAFSSKHWRALVDHVRHNFTTTMSCANAAMPGCRGWYRMHTAPQRSREGCQVSI